ncbi:ArsR family transcriptional regulator [Actinoplanes cyaneus]|uniref:ArsR family transcriptional regulator n=1 Tax=Actinoplanes cyaneus TaxID=52696 RepID=A0A919ILA0_9ACTN|nr:transcriptional regulator [Actinoplanes cyaneus]MCW2140550.1 putative transcriptional regulator, ArsR family [Actinoplanes cyaneus]GID67488.1 ArsR family transcriptional regulator [Actinoplanes cyaneus]
MTTSEDLDDLDALTSLADRVRRQAYRVVAGGTGPVGRDEVAEALGVGRTLAAFHLDKLVAAGLLETSYARRSGKTGPGAGRPAKLYRVAAAEHTVSVPPRAYRTAAELLAEALEEAGAENVLNTVARRHGRRVAGAADDVVELLTGQGYAPAADGPGRIELRNCPFHRLAEHFPPVICGMNLAMVDGLLAGAGLDGDWEARMDAAPGRCCVSLASKKQTD